ncbi:Trans-aconitate methyltransferase [Ectopseudomonas mendocina]|uniref:Trans-aconitate methyltransferase n=2 Tax=Ectopseudomonas mendocina TaxID=300 RepID=A0A379PM09_ECTME|nr:Trans-aconitate methyltransferase [Pseudomonas mendocina]
MKSAKLSSMLFLGCGDGVALNELASRYESWSFVGVDFNSAYVERADQEAPANVSYLCADFSEIDERVGIFGVIASPGLLSWISDESVKDVFSILMKCSTPGTLAHFGYDSEFFWGDLKGFREAFLDLWLSLGDMTQARMLIHSLVSSMPVTESKRNFLDRMVTDDKALRNWMLQPHWKPYFPSEIDDLMTEAGFELEGQRLDSISYLLNPSPYIEANYRRRN